MVHKRLSSLSVYMTNQVVEGVRAHTYVYLNSAVCSFKDIVIILLTL